MLTPEKARSLTAALNGLVVLVVLVLVLTVALFFVVPSSSEANSTQASSGGPAAAAPKEVALSAGQQHGKELFTNNCAQCHAASDEVVVGPGLKGVRQRTPGDEWLKKWIRNSQAVVGNGDKYGVEVFTKYNKIAMSSFPNLKDQDITDILDYIDVAAK